MKWIIAFDAGCDMRNFDPVPGAHLELVPLTINLGSKSVVDDGNISLKDFQAMLDSETGRTGTACPSVGDWHKAMEKGENVIAVTISGSVSGSYQSAVIARDMILEEEPDKNIFVFDSVSGSGTMEFMVRKAVELIEKGCSFEEVCQGITDYRKHSEIFFLLQNIDNVMSNGRLNPIIGKAVKALKLCMLATVSPEGTMDVIAKVRTFGKTMDKSIAEAVKRGVKGKHIIISHCLNLKGAELMKSKLLEVFPEAAIEIRSTGLLCGYYAEKGGLIVALQD